MQRVLGRPYAELGLNGPTPSRMRRLSAMRVSRQR